MFIIGTIFHFYLINFINRCDFGDFSFISVASYKITWNYTAVSTVREDGPTILICKTIWEIRVIYDYSPIFIVDSTTIFRTGVYEITWTYNGITTIIIDGSTTDTGMTVCKVTGSYITVIAQTSYSSTAFGNITVCKSRWTYTAINTSIVDSSTIFTNETVYEVGWIYNAIITSVCDEPIFTGITVREITFIYT